MPPPSPRPVAYFSMEIALESAIPTYSGGLGVLSGDTLRAAADLALPVVGVTLVHHQGYLRQRLDDAGTQTEEPASWSPAGKLVPLAARVSVPVAGRAVHLRAWRYDVRGAGGYVVPVYLLDSALPENDPADQHLTDQLYGGDDRYRLGQEVVLGMGGVALLRALGEDPAVFHMNEGHAALLTLALLRDTGADPNDVRRRCAFTTHTPVAAGHDRFAIPLATAVLGEELTAAFRRHAPTHGALDMTQLAMSLSRVTNAVALRHADVTRAQNPGRRIEAITNGVHAPTWAGDAIAALLDRYCDGWRADSTALRYGSAIPLPELAEAHASQKRALLDEIRRRGQPLDPDAFTLVFARRATAYKRADLIFRDLDRLRAIAAKHGPLQLVFAGKAHAKDVEGKKLIARIHALAKSAGRALRVVYLADYDMALARLLCGGADVWLNNPEKPLEASGTSGMKAALNGVPSLSVLDGWWAEGHIEGVTGWSVGGPADGPSDEKAEAASLYGVLERCILPLYAEDPDGFTRIRRAALALNGSFFNTHRMVREYFERVYRSG